jgi:two-component sensor histidine kinase
VPNVLTTDTVEYRSSDDEWALSVADNGVGMPTGSEAPQAGLGTGIIEALAKNLSGDIEVNDTDPGTMVTVRHINSIGASEVSPAV